MKYRDWLMSLWVILSGVAFIAASLAAVALPACPKSSVEELLAAGRYVYVTVIAFCIGSCLIGAALRAARRAGNKNTNGMAK